jgi:hypothetical protein
MRSYHAARAVFSLFSTLAWIVILAGGALAVISSGLAMERASFGGGNEMVALMAAIPGAILSLLGFVMLVLSQIGRAGVDTAEYSQQMLQASRDHMEVSRQLVRQGEKLEQGYAALAAKLSSPSSVSYEGRIATAEGSSAAASPATPLSATGEGTTQKVGYADRLQIEQGIPMTTFQGADSKSTASS